MTRIKRVASFLMTLCIIMCACFCSSLTASAATQGNIKSIGTITVNTKANYWIAGSSSITLKQTKGEFSYQNFNVFKFKFEKKTGTGYAVFNIKAVPILGNGKTKTAKLSGSSVKLNLDKDTTYRITVTYDATATNLKHNFKNSWTKMPTWRVSGSWKVSSYY